jgi:hypothetical protein
MISLVLLSILALCLGFLPAYLILPGFIQRMKAQVAKLAGCPGLQPGECRLQGVGTPDFSPGGSDTSQNLLPRFIPPGPGGLQCTLYKSSLP